MWQPFGPSPAERVPRTLFAGWIRYRDVVELYMPERVLRQLGYVQMIPRQIFFPDKVMRPMSAKAYTCEWNAVAAGSWNYFPRMFMCLLHDCTPVSGDPSECEPAYMSWYYQYSHPLIVNSADRHVPSVPHRSNYAYVSFSMKEYS